MEDPIPCELFREEDQFQAETVFILGNGLFKKGWEIVEQGLYTFARHEKKFPLQLHSHAAQEALQFFSMKEKFAKKAIIREMLSLLHGAPSDFELIKHSFDMILRYVNPLREILAKLYLQTPDLQVNQGLLSLAMDYGLEDAKTGLVTLNWDPFLWNYKDSLCKNLIYLHGSAHSPKTILLPTQSSEEEAYFQVLAKDLHTRFSQSSSLDEKKKYACLDLLCQAFLPPANETEYWQSHAVHLSYARGRCLKWLREAKRLVFCAVHVNSYDHHLQEILTDATFALELKQVKECICINQDKTALSRLQALLPLAPERIKLVQDCGFWRRLLS